MHRPIFVSELSVSYRLIGYRLDDCERDQVMKFGILVNEGPYQHQASDSAYQFTKAALEKGHEIFRVFFYHDGVNNGTRLATPPQDDRNITTRWGDLAAQYNLDLVICIAAAQRRGIVDEDEMKRQGKDANNIAPGFRISGLGQLIESGIQSDRLVVFGD
uniref:tRNA 2-thiouridine synthesizing protein D n=1 Tax=Candidatus Kentrum eta TaxID=2126337 RepID=A0A450UH11_9GAMM|nr:MAG: tRNA 2-thiouridine synthesizing protein D [Candidatus Kentron sp. H]VFJ92870.1 MAG: tRNA 2-thiouridine synthesizing protein D [Candidatus Kentron sp. H]VFJ99681.1 MAG: tRNA 2-thiouridine synthesizing protein D [Candidatus Kentron sp. H]